MPEWAHNKQEAFEALAQRWLGKDKGFTAVSELNKANHGSRGTHSARSRNTDSYRENLVHMEQLAFISSHVPTSYTQHLFGDAGVCTRGSYYPDVCVAAYEAEEARSEPDVALTSRVLWQCRRELERLLHDVPSFPSGGG
jgi:hypothetical protein